MAVKTPMSAPRKKNRPAAHGYRALFVFEFF
jgi:hypothetical protein